MNKYKLNQAKYSDSHKIALATPEIETISASVTRLWENKGLCSKYHKKRIYVHKPNLFSTSVDFAA